MSANALEPIAGLSEDSRHAFITGLIACLEGEEFELNATVTQVSSGAQAGGSSTGFCEGGIEQWTVAAVANGAASFREGTAHACVLARRLEQGFVLDERRWCRDVTLVTMTASTSRPAMWKGASAAPR